jgi:hypothetical protein
MDEWAMHMKRHPWKWEHMTKLLQTARDDSKTISTFSERYKWTFFNSSYHHDPFIVWAANVYRGRWWASKATLQNPEMLAKVNATAHVLRTFMNERDKTAPAPMRHSARLFKLKLSQKRRADGSYKHLEMQKLTKVTARKLFHQYLEYRTEHPVEEYDCGTDGNGSLAKRIPYACGIPDCKGRVRDGEVCDTCGAARCSKCRASISPPSSLEEHTCAPDDLASIQSLNRLRDARPCPRCSIVIQRIMGCNDMWCPQCATAFDFGSGEIITDMRGFSNPHMNINGGRARDEDMAEWTEGTRAADDRTPLQLKHVKWDSMDTWSDGYCMGVWMQIAHYQNERTLIGSSAAERAWSKYYTKAWTSIHGLCRSLQQQTVISPLFRDIMQRPTLEIIAAAVRVFSKGWKSAHARAQMLNFIWFTTLNRETEEVQRVKRAQMLAMARKWIPRMVNSRGEWTWSPVRALHRPELLHELFDDLHRIDEPLITMHKHHVREDKVIQLIRWTLEQCDAIDTTPLPRFRNNYHWKRHKFLDITCLHLDAPITMASLSQRLFNMYYSMCPMEYETRGWRMIHYMNGNTWDSSDDDGSDGSNLPYASDPLEERDVHDTRVILPTHIIATRKAILQKYRRHSLRYDLRTLSES